MPDTKIKHLSAAELKTMLHDGAEIAVFDLREAGQFGESHLLFATPLPYSRLELDVFNLLPRLSARLVVCDDGVSGIAAVAAAKLCALGYRDVALLNGGIRAWQAAGFALFRGVNVPSKTLGELVEHACHTPRITAQELVRMSQAPVLVKGQSEKIAARNIGLCVFAVATPNGYVVMPGGLTRVASSSGGVWASCPSQNGHSGSGAMCTCSREKSEARLRRSVETMTHRPVTGSLRSSDIVGRAFETPHPAPNASRITSTRTSCAATSTTTTSNRHGCPSSRCRARKSDAMCAIRRCFIGVMAAAPPPKRSDVRAFTSTNTIVGPSRATMSISPALVR